MGFHLGTLHGYFFHKDFWPNLNFLLEDKIKLVLTFIQSDEQQFPVIFFIFERKMISIAIFDIRENDLFSVYLFLGEKIFIRQAVVSTDLQKKVLFFCSF